MTVKYINITEERKGFLKGKSTKKIFEKKESESDMIRFLIYLDVIAIK